MGGFQAPVAVFISACFPGHYLKQIIEGRQRQRFVDKIVFRNLFPTRNIFVRTLPHTP
jgi:hypothetical protein